MEGYLFDSGLVTGVNVNNGDTLTFDLTGFESVEVKVVLTALNGTYFQMAGYLGDLTSNIQAGITQKMLNGEGSTLSLKGVSSGLVVQFQITGGAQTATLSYRVIGRG